VVVRAWEFRAEREATMRRWLLLIGVALIALLPCHAAEASTSIRAFTPRFVTNDTGDIFSIGNTLLTCSSQPGDRNAANCPAAQAGGLFGNQDFKMVYVDVDGDASTFNSSTARLSLPTGASVLWAGLYWGADLTGSGPGSQDAPNPALRSQVRLRTPASINYVTVTASQLDASGDDYSGFADVTVAVQAGGSGDYTVADVQAGTGSDQDAGWALVVVFRAPGLPARNLVVFDGFAAINNTPPSTIAFTVSGFTTPLSGPVQTRVGVVAYEGDRDASGDRF
jgi:hypothetical protein